MRFALAEYGSTPIDPGLEAVVVIKSGMVVLDANPPVMTSIPVFVATSVTKPPIHTLIERTCLCCSCGTCLRPYLR